MCQQTTAMLLIEVRVQQPDHRPLFRIGKGIQVLEEHPATRL